MKNVLRLFLSLLSLCIGSSLSGQTQTVSVALLDTGQMMPDFTVSIENYPQPELRLNDLRGKLVLLDFWSVTCKSCIAAMPKMQQLQTEFGDKIQIILVTGDTYEQVENLKKRSQIFREVSLPSVIQDTSLLKRFPIRAFPVHVWISREGRIDHIAAGHNTHATNIAKYLEGERLPLAKINHFAKFNEDEPLFSEGDGRHLDNFLFHSYLTTKIAFAGGLVNFSKDPQTGGLTMVKLLNVSKLQLFQAAIGQAPSNIFRDRNRVELNVADPQTFVWPSNRDSTDIWSAENTYCYEIKVKPEQSHRICEWMKGDLENYFGVKATVQKRLKRCWAIMPLGEIDRLKTKGDFPHTFLNWGTENPAEAVNVGMDEVILWLNDICRDFDGIRLPFADETGIDFPVDIYLPNDLKTIGELALSLRAQGLDLVEKNCLIEVLVISDY